MSETKHTKGPWEWRRDQTHGKYWSIKPGILIAMGTDGTPGGDSIDQANANLIVAAPDLLSSLKTVLESWRETADAGPIHSGYQSEWMLEQIAIADAAIAKVEGK